MASATPGITGHVCLTVHKALSLPDEHLVTKNDPYLRVFLDTDSKEGQKKQTDDKRDPINPVFNEEFDLDLKGHERYVHVEVWSRNLVKDSKIGGAAIPLSELVKHSGVSTFVYGLLDSSEKNNAGSIELAVRYDALPESKKSSEAVQLNVDTKPTQMSEQLGSEQMHMQGQLKDTQPALSQTCSEGSSGLAMQQQQQIERSDQPERERGETIGRSSDDTSGMTGSTLRAVAWDVTSTFKEKDKDTIPSSQQAEDISSSSLSEKRKDEDKGQLRGSDILGLSQGETSFEADEKGEHDRYADLTHDKSAGIGLKEGSSGIDVNQGGSMGGISESDIKKSDELGKENLRNQGKQLSDIKSSSGIDVYTTAQDDVAGQPRHRRHNDEEPLPKPKDISTETSGISETSGTSGMLGISSGTSSDTGLEKGMEKVRIGESNDDRSSEQRQTTSQLPVDDKLK